MAFVAVSGLVAVVLGRFHGEWAARIGGAIAGFMAIIMGTATAIITPMAMPTVGMRATTTLIIIIIIAISTCGPPTCT